MSGHGGLKRLGADDATGGVTDFRGLFLVPLAAASVAAIVLAVAFKPPTPGPAKEGAAARAA